MEFVEQQRERGDSGSSSSSGGELTAGIAWDALATDLSAGALQVLADLGIKGPVKPDDREGVAANLVAVAEKKAGGQVVNEDFKKHEYWDARFETEEQYDWLCTYSSLRSHLIPFLKPSDRILVVGCGNSTFSADLYDDGFRNITNIDYSANVVQAMAAKHSIARPEMLWIEMNMLKLSFDTASFDVVIDKAAMDAIMVDEGDLWHPKEECIQSAHDMCIGIARVLTERGIHLQISFAQPHFRTKYLKGDRYRQDNTVNPYSTSLGVSEVYPWDLQYETIAVEKGCLDSFLYIMRKI